MILRLIDDQTVTPMQGVRRTPRNIQIREIRQQDSEQFSALLAQLAEESDYTLLTASEYRAGAATQASRTAQIIQSPSQQIFVSCNLEQLVGFVAISQGIYQRNAHCGSLMIGVSASHQRRGIGRRLMQAALEWASSRDIERIELTVAEANLAAIGLYQQFGFIREGVKLDAYRVDGRAVNEWMMARIVG
ncbi:MAG: GNAT family N-acetyltransferase [Nitrosomonas sp.]|nr:GNAT family N-acetyltransferase [Nitrosomonas sp.]